MSVSQTPERIRGKRSERILLGIVFLGLAVLNLMVVFGVPAYFSVCAANVEYRDMVNEEKAEVDRLKAEAAKLEQILLAKVKSGVPPSSLYGSDYIKDPYVRRELFETLCLQLEDPRLQIQARAAELLAQFSSFEEFETRRRSQLVRQLAGKIGDPVISIRAMTVLTTLGPDAKPALPAISRAIKQCPDEVRLEYLSDGVHAIDPTFNVAGPIVEGIRDDSGASEYSWFATDYLQRKIPRKAIDRAIFDALQDNLTPEQRQRLKKLSRHVGSGTIE